MRSIYRKNKN